MWIKECRRCIYLVNLIATKQGVRCSHPDRSPQETEAYQLPLIAKIDNCQLKELPPKKPNPFDTTSNDQREPIDPFEGFNINPEDFKRPIQDENGEYIVEEIHRQINLLGKALKEADPAKTDLLGAIQIDRKISMLTEILDELDEQKSDKNRG